MKKDKTPQDILGIGEDGQFKPYQTKDGWTVVTLGAESGRRVAAGKTIVALSKVNIHLKTEMDVHNCIHHLEESDRRFALNNRNPWDWDVAMYKGLTVRFAVEWYDMEFFKNKKSAYLDPQHSKMYLQFGATIDNIIVEHYYVDKDGKESKV